MHRLKTGRPSPLWSDAAMSLLARHRWPGNVRELANIIERLAILHPGAPVGPTEVRQVLAIDDAGAMPPTSALLPDPTGLDAPLSEMLDDYERILVRCRLRREMSPRPLGVCRPTARTCIAACAGWVWPATVSSPAGVIRTVE